MIKLIQGDVLEKLKAGTPESVQTVITSPPYWGLRDYGVDGQIGLEKTPEEYVAKMVEIFAEVKRVLRPDGTLWLNLGDSYASGKGTCHNPGGNTSSFNVHLKAANVHPLDRGNKSSLEKIGLKPKDLIGIPWRVAFALQADGWYLRSCMPWIKRNPMPESCKDRPSTTIEYVFLLSKSKRYYYDGEAVKIDAVTADLRRPYAPGQVDGRGNGHDRGGGELRKTKTSTRAYRSSDPFFSSFQGLLLDEDLDPLAMVVNTTPYKGAHFATFPERLVEPFIKAGSKEGDLILDPFMGSGTVGAVCKRLNRRFVGIELNEEYIKLAQERMDKVPSQFFP